MLEKLGKFNELRNENLRSACGASAQHKFSAPELSAFPKK
jgi:hypothetical protein